MKRKPNNCKGNSNDNLVENIISYVKCNEILNDKYYSDVKNRKYSLDKLLHIIIDVLKTGIPWRSVSKLKITENIHWTTVYKTFMKMIKDNILRECYKQTLEKYLKHKPATKLNERYTDTTVIGNKYGIEKVGRNKCYKGKKITKISLITDSLGIPLNVKIDSGNRYDSAILYDQLNEEKCNMLINNENYKRILMADKGYDSSKLRKLIKDKGFLPLIPFNRRNTKNKSKIKHLSKLEKKKYRKRILIEHTFMKLKRNRRIDIRYEKMIDTYEAFVLLAILDQIIKTF